MEFRGSGVTEGPINLEGRRPAAEQLDAEMRTVSQIFHSRRTSSPIST